MSKTEQADFDLGAISPFLEMGSYEYLWDKHHSFPKLSEFLKEKFASEEKDPELFDHHAVDKRISNFVEDREAALRFAEKTLAELRQSGINNFGVRVMGEGEFPESVLDAKHPSYCLYYQGFWNFMETPCISVVGTRNPSEAGVKRTKQLICQLVEDGYTIVSGLASGIDTVAHETALDENGITVAVMGTALKNQYPKENQTLRDRLAKDYLVITQFPVSADTRPWFFTERNKIMSAITKATIIVEAGETSGTRTQARAALQQRRKLFILNNCFERRDLTWPQRFVDQGAIRVRGYEDIKRHLQNQ